MQATAKTPSTHTSTTESPHEHRRQSAESLFTRLGDPETRTTSFTTDCLERDKHRCVISGSISEAAWEELGSDEGTKWSNLEVHHIIPFSLADYDDKVRSLWPANYFVCDVVLTIKTDRDGDKHCLGHIVPEFP